MLAKQFNGMPHDVTEENLQARIRGVILMAISNKFGSMVATTGNKSEMRSVIQPCTATWQAVSP